MNRLLNIGVGVILMTYSVNFVAFIHQVVTRMGPEKNAAAKISLHDGLITKIAENCRAFWKIYYDHLASVA